jgi:tetratricopeptide (TPR) repeat protein
VLKIDPGYYEKRAKVALQRRDYATALDLYRRITRRNTVKSEVWAGLGFAAFQLRNLEDARSAFLRASALVDDPQYDYYAGIACASLGRWEEAVGLFQQSVRGGQGRYYHGLAVTLEGREAAHLAAGRPVDTVSLQAAAQAATQAAQLAPQNRRIARYRDHIARVVAGKEPPVATPR